MLGFLARARKKFENKCFVPVTVLMKGVVHNLTRRVPARLEKDGEGTVCPVTIPDSALSRIRVLSSPCNCMLSSPSFCRLRASSLVSATWLYLHSLNSKKNYIKRYPICHENITQLTRKNSNRVTVIKNNSARTGVPTG